MIVSLSHTASLRNLVLKSVPYDDIDKIISSLESDPKISPLFNGMAPKNSIHTRLTFTITLHHQYHHNQTAQHHSLGSVQPHHRITLTTLTHTHYTHNTHNTHHTHSYSPHSQHPQHSHTLTPHLPHTQTLHTPHSSTHTHSLHSHSTLTPHSLHTLHTHTMLIPRCLIAQTMLPVILAVILSLQQPKRVMHKPNKKQHHHQSHKIQTWMTMPV